MKSEYQYGTLSRIATMRTESALIYTGSHLITIKRPSQVRQ